MCNYGKKSRIFLFSLALWILEVFCYLRERGIRGLLLNYFKNLQSSFHLDIRSHYNVLPSPFPSFLFLLSLPSKKKKNYFGNCSPKQRFNWRSSIFYLLYCPFIMLTMLLIVVTFTQDNCPQTNKLMKILMGWGIDSREEKWLNIKLNSGGGKGFWEDKGLHLFSTFNFVPTHLSLLSKWLLRPAVRWGWKASVKSHKFPFLLRSWEPAEEITSHLRITWSRGGVGGGPKNSQWNYLLPMGLCWTIFAHKGLGGVSRRVESSPSKIQREPWDHIRNSKHRTCRLLHH